MKFYSTSHAAKIFNVEDRTIRRWIKEGKFPNAIKTGEGTAPWLIPAEDVAELQKKETPATRRGRPRGSQSVL